MNDGVDTKEDNSHVSLGTSDNLQKDLSLCDSCAWPHGRHVAAADSSAAQAARKLTNQRLEEGQHSFISPLWRGTMSDV